MTEDEKKGLVWQIWADLWHRFPKPVRAVFKWLCPITRDTGNPVDQSKLEVNTCSWREAREKVHEPITSGFSFTSDWIKSGASFLSQSLFVKTTGHFRITSGLFLEASLGAHPFIRKSIFIYTQIKLLFMWMKIHLHMKRWAPRLASKKRPEVIRKWRI